MEVETYYVSLVILLIVSFGVGLFYATTRARYFAYAGVFFYTLGLFIGVYYYG